MPSLKQYVMNEGTIEVPSNLFDSTVNVLIAPDLRNLSFSVARDKIPDGMSFEDYVLSEHGKLKEAFAEFSIKTRKIVDIGGKRCPMIQFSWKSPQGKMHQMMVMIQMQFRVLIMTASFQREITSVQAKQVIDVFKSFREFDAG